MYEPEVIKMMKKVFGKWEETTLPKLLDLANSSGREYGNKHELLEQFIILKDRFANVRAKDDLSKWLMICTKKNLYDGIPDILHFADMLLYQSTDRNNS